MPTPAVIVRGYMDNKSCLHYVVSDDGKIHASWEMENGMIFSVEYIAENHPALTIGVNATRADYDEAIMAVSWIRDNVPDTFVLPQEVKP